MFFVESKGFGKLKKEVLDHADAHRIVSCVAELGWAKIS